MVSELSPISHYSRSVSTQSYSQEDGLLDSQLRPLLDPCLHVNTRHTEKTTPYSMSRQYSQVTHEYEQDITGEDDESFIMDPEILRLNQTDFGNLNDTKYSKFKSVELQHS